MFTSTLIGKNVIVRDNAAGVFCGTLADYKPGTDGRGGFSVINNARKIHYWEGAGAVEGLAVGGLNQSTSRVTPRVSTVETTDVVQIVACEPAGYESIMTTPVWSPK